MVKNVGPTDRYIRFMVGISFLLNIIILKPGIVGSMLLLLIGGILLFTSFAGTCRLYTLLKINTCPAPPAPPEKTAPAGH